MDPRFRGDDGVFFRYRQIIRHSRIGKLFVTPESASYSSLQSRQVIRHSRVGKLFVIPESASYSSFRGGVAEPGNHGVRRLGADPTPSGSSLRHGLNPMDPRFRGDDGGALKRLRKRHAGLARMALA